jgi:hypothetical protein
MGADIFCVVCGARAYPALGPTGTRENFDLMSLDRDGRPADSPGSGKWFCARYFERIGGCCRVTAERIPANADPAASEATS